MRIEYIRVAESSEHFNVDVYEPAPLGATALRRPSEKIPAIVIAPGGGGKDLLTGDGNRGKHGAGYHDLAEYLANQGFWVLVPSRRGDPRRKLEQRSALCSMFSERLPDELFADHGPNEGCYTHKRQVAELETVIDNLTSLCGSAVNSERIGLLGKSAGCGVSLCLTNKISTKVSTLALWCSSLNSSQWFTGPKADDFFKRVLSDRQIRFERNSFVSDLCNAVDFVGQVKIPILFACTWRDSYAISPTEPDPWATAEEQMQLLHYAVNARDARVTVVKGAEHTMHRELPAWRSYAATLGDWFRETLLFEEGFTIA